MKVSASLTCANLMHLNQELFALEQAGIDAYHYDVSDGIFSPYLNLGDELFPHIKKQSQKPVLVHLAVENALPYTERFIKLAADRIAIHYESADFPQAFKQVKNSLSQVYIAFKADTVFTEEHLPWILESDGILKLLVNPGKSGQKMQKEALKDLRSIRNTLTYHAHSIPIEADGNVNPMTLESIQKSGADWVTGGSSGLFHTKDYHYNIKKLRGVL